MSETLRGTVSRVSDGDTLHIKTTTGKYKIRFYGIDAPESNQSFGSESADFVREKVLHKSVVIEKYHRKDCNFLKIIWPSYALYDAKEKEYDVCSRYY